MPVFDWVIALFPGGFSSEVALEGGGSQSLSVRPEGSEGGVLPPVCVEGGSSSPRHVRQFSCRSRISSSIEFIPIKSLAATAQTHPEIMQGAAEFHHQVTDALLPQANPVFHDATALDATVDMLDP